MRKQPEKEPVQELSEDVLGLKLDYCLADTVLKIASMIYLNVLNRLILLRK